MPYLLLLIFLSDKYSEKMYTFIMLQFSNVHDLARAIGKDEAYVSRLTRLTLLAPEIVHCIISGKLDKAGAKKCREPFPELWEEQIKFFGIK